MNASNSSCRPIKILDILATPCDDALMAKKQSNEIVTDQLRRLVRDSGLSCYAIAKETGVSESALSRFLSGERGLSGKALDTLGEYFGWTITARKPRAKGR